MIIDSEDKSATITSNIPGAESKKMGFDTDDEEAMEVLLSLLTNLYNDPMTAVIREYYTNAVDAHVKAGNPDPVLITLPTWSDPTYTVQDFGVGMSLYQIEKKFAQYLGSTKRKSANEMGAFGLGSKAAFTITKQFSLVSVQDGIKTSALFTMVADGTYDYKVIASVPTDESNGTTVKIPVDKEIYTFNNKARTFFSFSETGRAVVDGQAVTTVWDTYKKVESEHEGIDSYISVGTWGPSYIVMGTVPYVISSDEMADALERISANGDLGEKFSSIAKIFVVPIGAAHLTPNREGLRYTSKTNALLDKCLSSVVVDLAAMAVEDIESKDNLSDLFEALNNWERIVPEEYLTYNGKKVPNYIETGHAVRTITRNRWGNNRHSERYSLNLKQENPVLVLTGEPSSKYKSVSSYFADYMSMKGLTDQKFLITSEQGLEDNEWVKMSDKFTFIPVVTLKEQVKAWRAVNKPKTSSSSKKSSGNARGGKIKYPILDVKEKMVEWVDYTEIPAGIGYLAVDDFYDSSGFMDYVRDLHYRIGEDRAVPYYYVSRLLDPLSKADKVLLLGGGRKLESLKSRVKRVRNLKPVVVKYYEGLKKMSNDLDVIRYKTLLDNKQAKIVRAADTLGLDQFVADPILRTARGPKQSTVEKYKKLEGASDIFYFFRCSAFSSAVSVPYDRNLTESLSEKYPLSEGIYVGHASPEAIHHALKYLNMAHREHQKLDKAT